MPVTAKLNYLQIAPRKVRLVADLIRGKSVERAQTLLKFTVKKANEPVLKLLKSAIASARNNFHLQESNLYICKISVDEGPKYKRHRPRARGQAYEIQKKTSHIAIVLDEIKKRPEKVRGIKKAKEAAQVEKVSAEIEKPKVKPEIEIKKPKAEGRRNFVSSPSSLATGKGIKRIFRRKAF